MTGLRQLRLLKTSAMWAVVLAVGAVAGWGVSFFGYIILPLALIYGWLAGKLFVRFDMNKPILAGIVLFSAGVLARVLVGYYLVMFPDTPYPPNGAWQTIIVMFTPWPVPSIALLMASVVTGISIVFHNQKTKRQA